MLSINLSHLFPTINYPVYDLQGWIACGGDAGLLKVLKLEQATGADAQIGVSFSIDIYFPL